MNITPQTPQPKPPRNQRGSRWSWLFLLILARPLWGIIRSAVGPQVSSQQLALVIGGVVLAGVIVMFFTSVATRSTSREQAPSMQSSPAPNYRPPAAGPSMPSTTPPRYGTNPSLGKPPLPPSTPFGQAPRFEPIITGKVVLIGAVLAVVIVAALGVIAGAIL